MTINSRIKEIRKELFNDSTKELAEKLKISSQAVSNYLRDGYNIGREVIENIIAIYPSINANWLLTGEGEMLISCTNADKLKTNLSVETRPRIPLNAAAGTVSVALSGVTADDSEQLPLIQSFSNYSYTILVKGDSMEPEFHSGDELACLQLTNGKAKFIQWGRYHVLDTAQGVVVKRIYEKEEYVICKSENKDLYPDFEIHKDDIYNIGLVIGMLRRF